MTNITTPSSMPGLEAAWKDVDSSFDRFCLATSATEKLNEDVLHRISRFRFQARDPAPVPTESFIAGATRRHGGLTSPLIPYRSRSSCGSTHGSMVPCEIKDCPQSAVYEHRMTSTHLPHTSFDKAA
jgi:hypothetical protein